MQVLKIYAEKSELSFLPWKTLLIRKIIILKLLFRYIFFNRYISLLLSITLFVVFFILSIFVKRPDVFASSGALVTMLGLFLNIKHTMVFHLGFPLERIFHIKSGAGGFKRDFTPEGKKKTENLLKDESFGVWFMIIGTFVWAFGSLLIEIVLKKM
jgi:ABC-type phosphate transport system permease subunit